MANDEIVEEEESEMQEEQEERGGRQSGGGPALWCAMVLSVCSQSWSTVVRSSPRAGECLAVDAGQT